MPTPISPNKVLTPAMQVANTKVLVVSISSYLPSFDPLLPCVCKAFRVNLAGERLKSLNTKHASLKNEVQNCVVALKSLKKTKCDYESEIEQLNQVIKPRNFNYPGITPDTLIQLQSERNRLAFGAVNTLKEYRSKLDDVKLAIESRTEELNRTRAKLLEVSKQLFPHHVAQNSTKLMEFFNSNCVIL